MLLLSVTLPAAARGGGERRRAAEPDHANVKYGEHERQVFDLWLAKSESPTPLVIYIHGGGFRAGSKASVSTQLIAGLRAEGISVAAINYRLTQTAPFPTPMHDAARCVQFLRHHAKDYNLDAKRFGATGGSAGAGISLWLAFHDDLADAKAEDPIARESTGLSCALPVNGQCSYDPRFIKEHVGGRAHEHPALAPFWGLKPDELDTEKAHRIFDECSPIHHLTKDDPPVLMSFGGNDAPSERPGAGIHSEKFGHVLRERMTKLGLECEVVVGKRASSVAFFVKHLRR
jgi:acetyl esterase/lipase